MPTKTSKKKKKKVGRSYRIAPSGLGGFRQVEFKRIHKMKDRWRLKEAYTPSFPNIAYKLICDVPSSSSILFIVLRRPEKSVVL